MAIRRPDAEKISLWMGEIAVETADRKEKGRSIWDDRLIHGRPRKGFSMDTSTPGNPTADTYLELENRILDTSLPQIGVYGFAVYVAIQRHLAHPPASPPSYATIARKLGMAPGAVIRHVKTLQRLKLLSPTLHFIEGRAKRRDRR
jgi:hypothetical protein